MIMKKFALAAIVGAVALAATLPVRAATAVGNFNVNISLTSQCQINSTNPSGSATLTDVTFNYTSFQTSAASLVANPSFNVRCTNGLSYTMALDNAGSYLDAQTNLNYSLALSSAGALGNGSNQPYTISGSMGANQAGTCAPAPAQNLAASAAIVCDNSTSANRQRTLTITY
jgi:hypothetical protein